jgi:ATP-dependent helicase/nuclease subunit A
MGKWIDVHIKRDGAKALGWFKVEKRSEGSFAAKLLGEHADWEEHKAVEEPYLAAEEDRLLYVAATRARQMLVASRSAGNKGKPAWGVLNDNLGAAKELPVPATVKVASSKPTTTTAKAQAEALAARVAAGGGVNSPSWSITSVTAEAKHIAMTAAAGDPAATDDATTVVRQDTPSHRADAGMAWGTLIHGLLEHAMRHQNASREDLRRLAMWLTVEEPQLRTVIDEAIDAVERVAKAGFWSMAQTHARSVETPFTVKDDRRLTNGVIDLLFDSEAGWQVVDYKTDRKLSDGKYEAQLQAYRQALRQVGCRVAGTSIVNVRTEPASVSHS